MQGDEYFLKHIAAALKELQSGKTSPEAAPVHLTITTTLLSAQPRGVPDHFGTIIQDADHRGEFTFRRGLRVTSEDSETLGSEERDDFDDPRIIDRLALASRSTASFPFAFEASFVPVKEALDDRPDMDGVANFEMSRYVVDGGVLVNRPLRPALRAIFAQPAGPQVRRVVAYVVPDPGEAMKETADDLTRSPSWRRSRLRAWSPFLATSRSVTSSTISRITTRGSMRSVGDVSSRSRRWTSMRSRLRRTRSTATCVPNGSRIGCSTASAVG